jgi:hypothetical protein
MSYIEKHTADLCTLFSNFSLITDDLEHCCKKRRIEQTKINDYWNGYTKPHNELHDGELAKLKMQISSYKGCSVLTVECHHPYYRNILKEYAKSLGFNAKSSVDNKLKKNEDSMMLYHFACKKCTPVTKVIWYPYYGEISQMQSICDHCKNEDGKILSNHKNDKNSSFGYKYVRGENCLKIIPVVFDFGAI